MSGSVLGIDTNVLVRFYRKDDPDQFAQAAALIGHAADGELFIGPIVLVELNWVLCKVYRHTQSEVLGLLSMMMDTRQFTIGDRDLAVQAIAASAAANCDFSDALIGLLNQHAGCMATSTFDRRAQRLPQMQSVGGAS